MAFYKCVYVLRGYVLEFRVLATFKLHTWPNFSYMGQDNSM